MEERLDEHVVSEARALQRAYAVVNFCSTILGASDLETEGYETVLTDLLADLRHPCIGTALIS